MNQALHQKPPARAARGFTLIEVMIVVAIIAVLAAIAFPSYTEQLAKGRRSQVTSQMVAAQQWMERWYSENYSYAKNTANVAVTAQFLARFEKVPETGGTYYTLAVDATTNAYTITATRAGNMATDRCGNFTLDNLGRKSLVSGTYDTAKFSSTDAAVKACWR